MTDGRKVRAPQGSVAGNARLRPQKGRTDKSHRDESPPHRRGVKRGNLYAEQGQIGEKRRSVSLLFPGWLLDPSSNGRTRQMIILPDLLGRQNPAYRSTPHLFSIQDVLKDVLNMIKGAGSTPKGPPIKKSGGLLFENFLKKDLTNGFLWYIIFSEWEKVGESGS